MYVRVSAILRGEKCRRSVTSTPPALPTPWVEQGAAIHDSSIHPISAYLCAPRKGACVLAYEQAPLFVTEKSCATCRVTKPLDSFHRDKNRKDGHRFKCKACVRAYYDRTRDARIASSRAWQKAHPKACTAATNRWRKSHPDTARVVSAARKAAFHRYRSRLRNAEGSFTDEEWRACRDAHGNRCAICREEKKLCVDHIIPLMKGGSNYITNIQPLCFSCNSRKKDKMPEERSPEQRNSHFLRFQIGAR